MLDLENDLPDELISSSSWIPDHMGNQKPPAQGPGPGAMQNGIENTEANIRQIQINHLLQQVCVSSFFVCLEVGVLNILLYI